jgi:hypothetical protein
MRMVTHQSFLLGCILAFQSLTAVCEEAQQAEVLPRSLIFHWNTEYDHPASDTLVLDGGDRHQQILLTGTLTDGTVWDYTRRATYVTEPSGVAHVDDQGRIVPVGNGRTVLSAQYGEHLESRLSIEVKNIETIRPLNFSNQIVPIFTKTGCNGGGCHGKAAGQNGFRLSLLGFEPEEDYGFLVSEARGRRVFPAAPDRSLLLLKATGELPHGGGKRMDKESDEYQLLRRWIAQGMPYGNRNDPTVEHIEIIPQERLMPLESDQQLVVLAHYTDGGVEDVTRRALYESNQKDIAEVDSQGWVQLRQQPGDVAVMVRYDGHVGVFRATIPLGAPMDTLPNPNNFIDEKVFAKLENLGIPPSGLCDDATFIRRVTLDVAGRLPTEAETQAFLTDTRLNKRDRWIDHLLDGPDYADYFANKYSALLRNRRDNDKEKRGSFAFHSWIRDSFYDNKPYDQFVREILTASGEITQNPPTAWYREVNQAQEQLEDTAQLFLATRLKCAQCHHHPYERWSQRDYYQFSAFFSRVGRKSGGHPGEESIYHKSGRASATHPKSKENLSPAGLGATPVSLEPEEDPRTALAEWITQPENPFFARALVNRYWKHFLNRGLVEPEDDMRDTNPPTNPELLEALAEHFVSSGFDLKDLVRQICRSRTYQASATPNEFNAIDTQHFSRHYPQRLEAEVLLDAVDEVTGTGTHFTGLPPSFRAVQLPDNSFNQDYYFLTVFGRPESASACECERSMDASLAQSLHMLNSKSIQEKILSESGTAAGFTNDDPGKDNDNIRSLFLSALSREPTDAEMRQAKDYLHRSPRIRVDEQGQALPPDDKRDRRESFEDLIWMMLNMKEFLFNH